MASQEDKGNEWMEKADKKLKSFSLFNSEAKYEDAADMYIKAANSYKMAKNWDQAAKAYSRAAECQLKLQSKHEAASNYVQAATCLKKVNGEEAVNYLRTAVDLYTDEGRFSIAAKHQKEIAEYYEEALDHEKALEAYQKAADFYDGEGSTSAAGSCLLKVANFSAQLEKYERAIEIYEQVAKSSLENNLLKWSCKDYFMRAGLCHLCLGDVVSAKRAVEKYRDMDPSFANQRECKFLEQIIAATEDYNVENFTQIVAEYDSISPLDKWKVTLLLRIKNTLKQEDNSLA
jgi:alpha-soluble NSF attachment protein